MRTQHTRHFEFLLIIVFIGGVGGVYFTVVFIKTYVSRTNVLNTLHFMSVWFMHMSLSPNFDDLLSVSLLLSI